MGIIIMGLFGGGSSSGDTAGFSSGSSLDLSSLGDTSTSKLRSSSLGSDFDSSGSGFVGSAAATGGDFQHTLQIEQQKSQLMSQVHALNDKCWDKCITSVSNSLGGRSETCLTNCVDRFFDTTVFITQRFAQLASKTRH